MQCIIINCEEVGEPSVFKFIDPEHESIREAKFEILVFVCEDHIWSIKDYDAIFTLATIDGKVVEI